MESQGKEKFLKYEIQGAAGTPAGNTSSNVDEEETLTPATPITTPGARVSFSEIEMPPTLTEQEKEERKSKEEEEKRLNHPATGYWGLLCVLPEPEMFLKELQTLRERLRGVSEAYSGPHYSKEAELSVALEVSYEAENRLLKEVDACMELYADLIQVSTEALMVEKEALEKKKAEEEAEWARLDKEREEKRGEVNVAETPEELEAKVLIDSISTLINPTNLNPR